MKRFVLLLSCLLGLESSSPKETDLVFWLYLNNKSLGDRSVSTVTHDAKYLKFGVETFLSDLHGILNADGESALRSLLASHSCNGWVAAYLFTPICNKDGTLFIQFDMDCVDFNVDNKFLIEK